MSDPTPTLWHLPPSHYSEKVRWALAHKGIAHKRREPPPGAHMAVALWLTRGAEYTFPILTLDGRNVGDSSAIIAALEDRHPDRPLYPSDPAERRRALALEEFFDAELGPGIRTFAWYEFGNDIARMEGLMEHAAPAPLARYAAPVSRYARAFTRMRFGAADAEAAARGRAQVVAALDRLDAELEAGGGEYLAGGGFSVADLTAASLFYPLVAPEGGPVPADFEPPGGIRRLREETADRPGYRWVEETYRRHRRPAPA